MAEAKRIWQLGELAQAFGGKLDGPEDGKVLRPVAAGSVDAEGLSFAESEKYLAKAETGVLAAIILPENSRETALPSIRVKNPRIAFAQFLGMYRRPLPLEDGIHPTAIVSPEATVHPSAKVGAYAVVERGTIIEAGASIYPFVYVGEDCEVGQGTVLFPHVTLYQEVRIGARCIIHAHAVLGADGFGFVFDGKRHHKIPQVGRVSLGDDVEIGALSAIDRAATGTTMLGDGVKVDNLVQIAHNVEIGDHVVIASQSGVAGSAVIGHHSVMAGRAGVIDHITLQPGSVVGVGAIVTENFPEATQFLGNPARPAGEMKRTLVHQRRLDDYAKRIKKMEKELEELRNAISTKDASNGS